MIRAWAVAFVWTLALELPVYLALVVGPGRDRLLALLLGLQLNLATHPVFSIWVLSTRPGIGAIVAAELVIVAVEGELLRHATGGDRAWAWRAALAANAFSFLAGMGLRRAGLL